MKERRCMLFLAKIDGDGVAPGIPTIDKAVGKNGSRPAFAVEDLRASGGFEAFGRNGCDHQLSTRGQSDDFPVGDDDSSGAKIGLCPNFFAGFDFDALEARPAVRVAIHAVEMFVHEHGSVELGPEDAVLPDFVGLTVRGSGRRVECATFAVAAGDENLAAVGNGISGVHPVFLSLIHISEPTRLLSISYAV